MSWTGTIGAALAAAQSGDVIYLNPGVYSGPGNVDLVVDRLQATLGPG